MKHYTPAPSRVYDRAMVSHTTIETLIEQIGFTKLHQATQTAFDQDRITEKRARRIIAVLNRIAYRQLDVPFAFYLH